MRIGIDAHTTEKNRTGPGRVLFNLIKEWAKMDLSDDFILYFKEEIPKDLPNVFEKRLLKPVLGHQSNALFIHWLLPQAAKKDKLDLLFCPNYIAPVFYKGKTVLSLYDISYEARPKEFNWPSLWDRILLKKVSKISAKKAQLIITCSKFSQKEIIKHYQIKPEKVKVALLAASDNFKKIDGEKVRDKYGLNKNFVLFLGSMFDRRHLKEIIKAFTKLSLSDYQLFLVGQDFTKKKKIDDLIKKANQALGWPGILKKDFVDQKDLPALYSAASVFIYLSDYEGFGLPVLEAMSCGTLVITSQTSSLSEVAGSAALYVKDNGDIEEIKEAMRRGLTDKDLRQKLIEKGLKQARKFSWQKCARETLNFISEVDFTGRDFKKRLG